MKTKQLIEMTEKDFNQGDRPGALKVLRALKDTKLPVLWSWSIAQDLISLCYVDAWKNDSERKHERGFQIRFEWLDTTKALNGIMRELVIVFFDTPITYGATKHHVEAFSGEINSTLNTRKSYCVFYDELDDMVEWIKSEFVRIVKS